ncbi:unknown [Singapore grouper iridovirus]|uniref:Uncharacterized protein n=1 Tax=Singapore grouper iridovirus TaxID=262968 RepID=Q5YFH8_9VIRU|nr:hypothetical protein ORF087R [Singapore grouper iridovirus]AAS18102.1 unknown [Singapore grouper iridovirus]WAU86796.1 hypothetical protein ORF087R [Singapore grouper iridovirus]
MRFKSPFLLILAILYVHCEEDFDYYEKNDPNAYEYGDVYERSEGIEYNVYYKCKKCLRPNVTTEGFSVKMQRLQRKAFLSFDYYGTSKMQRNHAGEVIKYANNDTWIKTLKNGLTIPDGYTCNTKCGPWSYNVHWCQATAENTWYKCALPGKDSYGRICEEIYKDMLYQVYCYVENRNSYWAHNGGTWGYTHPPLCFPSHESCKYIGAGDGYLDS